MSQQTGRPEDPTRGRGTDDLQRRRPPSRGSYDDDYEDDLDDDEDRPRGFVGTVLAGIKELVIVIILAMALSFVVKTWLFQAFYIPSGSMEDTLVRDDRVIVSKLTPGPFDLRRGDVVVFEDPGTPTPWLSGVENGSSTVGGPFHEMVSDVAADRTPRGPDARARH